MNLRQSYEHLIAHKLRKLPAPDADVSWQQMKRLLDEDDDTRAGGKRNPGNGSGGWRIGIIAIILSASGWFYFNNTTAPGTGIAKATTTTSSNNNQSSTIDKKTTLSVSPTSKTIELSNGSAVPTGAAPRAFAEPQSSAIPTGELNNDKHASGNIANAVNDNSGIAEKQAEQTQTNANEPVGLVSINNKRVSGVKESPDNSDVASNSDLVVSKLHLTNGHSNYTSGKGTRPGINGHLQEKKSYGSRLALTSNHTDKSDAGVSPVNKLKAANTDWLATLSDLNNNAPFHSSNTLLAAGDSIDNNRSTAQLLNAETKKSVAKAQRDKELEDMTRKDHKRFHLDLSNAFKPFSLHMDAEPRWAAGIALNNGITLGAQDRFNYSMNAKSGVLTDYIPSLYLQFHLNDYVFAQTELNFISPQYTPQLLVFRQNNDVTAQAGISQQKSVFIQKLYYFSIPVSLHYSPINNLYFSAGLQFSSFQSGLATIQEKQYTTSSGPDHPNSISNTVLKFKDDSIAAKLAPNEWRWQAGAEYYFNRFTVGLRYNRSFKNLVTSDAASTVPAAAGLHNQSMILFMRYNLFESRKKKTNAE